MNGWQGGEAGDAGEASVRTEIWERKDRRSTVNSVDNGDNLEKLREIIWCDHLGVVCSPLIGSETPHIFLHDGPVYLVVEENVVKLICPPCWLLATGHHKEFSRGSA